MKRKPDTVQARYILFKKSRFYDEDSSPAVNAWDFVCREEGRQDLIEACCCADVASGWDTCTVDRERCWLGKCKDRSDLKLMERIYETVKKFCENGDMFIEPEKLPTQTEYAKWKKTSHSYDTGDTDAENAWTFLCLREGKEDLAENCCCGAVIDGTDNCRNRNECWREDLKDEDLEFMLQVYARVEQFYKNGNKFLKRPKNPSPRNRITIAITDIIREASS